MARARINETRDKTGVIVQTQGNTALDATAYIRERADTETGRSLTGLNVTTNSGETFNLNGFEARTLYRVLQRAVQG